MQLRHDLVDLIDDRKQGISYQLIRTVDIETRGIAEDECLVRAALVENTLSSSKSMLHTLIPQDYIVELDSLNRLLSADFKGCERHTYQELLDQHKLYDIPALPKWHNLPCLIDSEVFFYDYLLLDLGNRQDILRLSRDNFIKLIERSLRSKISSPVLHLASKSTDPGVEFAQRRLKQRIDETLEIPPLKRSAQHIFELRAQDKPSSAELCEIIELDPSLAAQVVSWAASPYYSGQDNDVNSVQEAVNERLGFDMVMNMILGLALGKPLNSEIFKAPEQDTYSRISVLIACICETLAQETRDTLNLDPKHAYICGLINDLGSIILGELFPLYKVQIDRALIANPHLRRTQIERYITGCDSHDVAVWTMENWNMPETVISAIRQCGAISLDDIDNDYTKLILIAQHQLTKLGIAQSSQTKIEHSWWQKLNLSETDMTRRIKHLVRLEGQLYPVAVDNLYSLEPDEKLFRLN